MVKLEADVKDKSYIYRGLVLVFSGWIKSVCDVGRKLHTHLPEMSAFCEDLFATIQGIKV